MLSSPYSFFFISSLIVSSLVALSSSQWLVVWVALELNMMSFIPLFMLDDSGQSAEAGVKYFLVQALGSIVLLFSFSSGGFYGLVVMGFMLKGGMAPFHFWFPQVMSGANWVIAFLLLTWQKIIPLFFICYNSMYLGSVIYFLGMLNTIVGGVGGLNQTSFRPLLAYSSIGHMGWMIVGGSLSSIIFLIYFGLYVLLNLGIMLLLSGVRIKGLGVGLMGQNMLVYSSLVLCLMSLGGMPPLVGFFPKWMVLSSLSVLSVALVMIFGSLMNLFYYMSICFAIYMSNKNYLLSVSSNITITLMNISVLFLFVNLMLPLFLMI